jgi:hypothetical protein
LRKRGAKLTSVCKLENARHGLVGEIIVYAPLKNGKRLKMKNSRLPIAVVFLLLGGSTLFVACGGDDSNPGTAPADASNGDATTSDVSPTSDSGGATDAPGGETATGDGGDGAPLGPECRPSGWCWENPVPWGDHVAGVWGAAANDVWAVGWAGAIFHWDGTAWSRAKSPTLTNLYGIWGASATNAWAVGDRATILHWDGSAWTIQQNEDGGYDAFHAISGTSASDVWVEGYNRLWHYDGANWNHVTAADADGGVLAIGSFATVFDRAPGDVWIGSGSPIPGNLAHWNGTYWTQVDIQLADGGTVFVGSIQGIWAAPTGEVFVARTVGTGSDVFELKGGVWTQSTALSGATASALWGTSATDVTFVGGGGTTLHFDGGGWTPMSGANPVQLEAIAAAGSDTWVVGADATFLRKTGTTWAAEKTITSVTTKTLNGVSALSADEAWAVGNTVLHRTAQGWATANTLDDAGALEDMGLTGVSALASNDVWASGPAGAYHWDGTKWSLKSALVDGGAVTSLVGISAVSGTSVWAASGGTVLRYDGVAWSVVPFTAADGGAVTVTGPGFLFGLVARTASDVWAGGPFNLLHYDGAGWTELANVDAGVLGPLSGIAPISSTEAWVVSGFATVAFHWTGGSSFTDVPIGGDWSDGLFRPEMAASSANDVWVVARGGIGHWNGALWTYSDRPSPTLGGVSAVNGNAWVVGQEGAILHHAP